MDPGEPRRLLQDIHDFRVFQVVEDIAPIAVRRYQAGLAQDHQVLRDARLAHSQHSRKVAHAGLARADDQENLNAGRLADDRKQVRDLFFRMGRSIRWHAGIVMGNREKGK